MKRYANLKPMIRYRFKDRMNCVFFRDFKTDHEARLWFERNKIDFALKELSNLGPVYPNTNTTRYFQ